MNMIKVTNQFEQKELKARNNQNELEAWNRA
jgi:hypothetical protein